MHEDIHRLQAKQYREMEEISGWNRRICSSFSITHAPELTAFVLRAGISRCPRQRNTTISFDALAALTDPEAEQEFRV